MKKTTLILLFLTLFVSQIFSEESSYALKMINYDIKGSTNIKLLENKLKFHEGMVFKNKEEVETFVKSIEQDLINLRYYEEVKVSYKIENNLITLDIYLDEAWNIIPFGIPKINSETGVRASLKLFWNNTLGTLSDTSLVGGFNIGRDSDDEDFKMQSWDATLSVSQIYLWDKYFNISLSQALRRQSKGEDKWSFHTTSLSTGTSFNLPYNYSYSVGLSLAAEYRYLPITSGTTDSDIVKNPIKLSFSHGIGTGDINWIGNFKDGYSYGLGNSLYLVRDSSDNIVPATNFSLSGSYHKKIPTLPISLSTRLTFDVSFNDEMLGLGSKNRGVQSGDMYGNYGIFLNNNIYISTFKVKNVAEAIFAPSFDIGTSEGSGLKYSAGADFILYVDKLKSMVARGTLSWDLTDGFNIREFEYNITSSLYF